MKAITPKILSVICEIRENTKAPVCFSDYLVFYIVCTVLIVSAFGFLLYFLEVNIPWLFGSIAISAFIALVALFEKALGFKEFLFFVAFATFGTGLAATIVSFFHPVYETIPAITVFSIGSVLWGIWFLVYHKKGKPAGEDQ